MKTIKTSNYIKKAQNINPLDGKSNQQARSIVNNKIIPKTPGFYSDENWEGINKIWTALNEAGLNWTITGSKYKSNEQSVPIGKTWTIEIYFTNNKRRETVLSGTVTAAGSGTVNDPLSRYDITAYVF